MKFIGRREVNDRPYIRCAESVVDPEREIAMQHLLFAGENVQICHLEQWYATGGTRRHLIGYVKFKKKISL